MSHQRNPRNSRREIWRWTRRWFRTAKPTEWISACTQLIGVVGTIIAAIVLVKSGFLDQRKSELEAKRSEIATANIKLEIEQKELLAKNEAINKTISDNTKMVRKKEEQIADLEIALSRYTANELALAFLTKYKESDQRTLDLSMNIRPEQDEVSVTIKPITHAAKPAVATDIDALLSHATNLLGLTTLSIEGIQLEVGHIRMMTRPPRLHGLNLQNCGLNDGTFCNVVFDQQLWGIDFSGNRITVLPGIKEKASSAESVGMYWLGERA